MTYTTTGSVRGNCGHAHRSIEAAYQCLRADQKGCDNQGGYSDRSVVRKDGESFTAQERAAYEAAQEAEYDFVAINAAS